MTSRRMLGAMVCASVTFAIAGSANAATYTGRAVDDPRTRIEFEKTGGEIRDFEVRGAKFRCDHDPPFRDRDGITLGTMRLRADDTFRGEFFNLEDGAGATARGALAHGTAEGAFRIDVAPRASELCTTRRVAWRAHRI